MYNLIKIATIIILASVFTFAQTSGPNQPDFMKFSQINLGNNVNEFDGSFNYSIPVLAIPSGNKIGYSLQLTYQSGSGPNDEATWVGFGWSLNPGSITRQVKGFPDDFDGVEATIYTKVKQSISVSDLFAARLELFSADFKPGFSETHSFSNNYGYKKTNSYSLASQLFGGISFSKDNTGHKTFTFSLSPGLFIPSNKEATPKDISHVSNAWNQIYSNVQTAYSLFKTKSNWGKGEDPLNIPSYEGTTDIFTPKAHIGVGFVKAEANLPDLTRYVNTQKYIPNETNYLFGYMYSGKGYSLSNSKYKVMMDYYNEKESGLSMRNRNLGVPFSNPDNFIVSGNGIDGSFKLYSKKIGLFKPKQVESKSSIVDNSITFGFTALNFLNVGYDGMHGKTTVTVKGWDGAGQINTNNDNLNSEYYVDNKNSSLLYSYSTNQDIYTKYNTNRDKENIHFGENYFFKFSSDMNSRQTFNQILPWEMNNPNLSTLFSPINSQIKNYKLYLANNSDLLTILNSNQRVARSNFIDYTLCGESNGTNSLNAFDIECTSGDSKIDYSRIDNYDDTYNSDLKNKSKLKEFKIVNKEGATYCYGLAVKNSDEYNASFILTKLKYEEIEPETPGTDIFTNDGIIVKNSGMTIEDLGKDNDILGNGKRVADSYASTFLLTKIYSPDYIDLTMDGPSLDDIGDYVIFNYRKATAPYKWREPYVGLTYQKNSISDSQDDNGNYSAGTKEIYYLESIETKTHVAVFVTNKFDLTSSKISYKMKVDLSAYRLYELDSLLSGSKVNRTDAYQSLDDEKKASNGLQSDVEIFMESNDNILERLEKIVLFSKDLAILNENDGDRRAIYLRQKLQTTILGYDESYPIWPNMRNSYKHGTNIGGKLTLDQLWIDKEDAHEAKVS